MSLLELSCAPRQLAQYRPVKRPGVICRNASEPGIYIDTAAQAISCISRDLRGPGDDAEPDQPGTAAATAVRDLADATYTAFTAIRQPSGSLPAKDAAVSAFMHAIGIIDTAIGNLAACTPDPLAAVLTRQRIRLEQACRSLREALVCSAVSQDDRPSLAAADRIPSCTRSCRIAPRPRTTLPATRPPRLPVPATGTTFPRRASNETGAAASEGQRGTPAVHPRRPTALPAPRPAPSAQPPPGHTCTLPAARQRHE